MSDGARHPLGFIVVGAMKSATTSLYDLLARQPNVDLCSVKEVNYFNYLPNWQKGEDWYAKYFRLDGRMRCDVNPNYAMLPHGKYVAKRIFEHSPGVKIVFIVRDPISRTESHIKHYIHEGKENRSVESIFKDLHRGQDANGYIGYSRYYLQIAEFMRYFKLEQCYFLRMENAITNSSREVGDLFTFLGLQYERDEEDMQVLNSSFRKRRYSTTIKWLIGSEFTGQIAHKFVLFLKKILPNSLYEMIRTVSTQAPPNCNLTKEHYDFLYSALVNDYEKFRELVKSRIELPKLEARM